MMKGEATMSRFRVGIISLLSLGALGFGWFVWPTPYKPIPISNVPDVMREHAVAARQNRFSGEIQWLPVLSYRWFNGLDPSARAETTSRVHRPDALDSLAREAQELRRGSNKTLWR